jgi:outer membrane beta-barrel protein
MTNWPSKNRQLLRSGLFVTLVVTGAAVFTTHTAFAESGLGSQEQFKDVEIRVIRPKFFTKTKRLETGAQLSVVMNQSFIYTYLATGLLDYHFSEQWAAEGAVAMGFSIDKDDKRSLKSNFKIQTQILRTQYFMEGGALYTPVYGKYQLDSGKLIYLDVFFSGGVGMTGINYLYDHCPKPTDVGQGNTVPADPPSPTTKTYLTFYGGLGQRVFMDKKLSLRWDVRAHTFGYNLADSSCDPETATSGTNSQTNITLQLGAGYFL